MTNMLTVISVDPPDEESASVTLRSEYGEIVAFCWPCGLKAGDVIENRLTVLEAEVQSVYFTDWPAREIEALSVEWIERTGQYAYRGRGRVANPTEGLIEVQGFVIELDGGYFGHVDFKISRLNI